MVAGSSDLSRQTGGSGEPRPEADKTARGLRQQVPMRSRNRPERSGKHGGPTGQADNSQSRHTSVSHTPGSDPNSGTTTRRFCSPVPPGTVITSWLSHPFSTVRKMTAVLSALPAHERPRERLYALGVEALSDRELLALVLRSGRPGESAVDLASSLLARFGGLAALQAAFPEEIAAVPGIGPASPAIRDIRLRTVSCRSIRSRTLRESGVPSASCRPIPYRSVRSPYRFGPAAWK